MAELGTEKLVCVEEAAETVVPLEADGPPAACRCCGRVSKYLDEREGRRGAGIGQGWLGRG